MRTRLAVFGGLILLARAARAAEHVGDFKTVDAHIARLSHVAGGYPPAVGSKRAAEKAKAEVVACVKELETLSAKGAPKWAVDLRIGECYRMGHNLDMPHAWERAEAHLKKAMALNPNEPKPCVVLGTLYVNSDMSLAPKAEELFREAIKRA